MSSAIGQVPAGEAPDYVLLGQAGYGISNLAIHYFLVVGPLALFVQVRWSGAYTDNEAAVARMRGAFSGAEELIVGRRGGSGRRPARAA